MPWASCGHWPQIWRINSWIHYYQMKSTGSKRCSWVIILQTMFYGARTSGEMWISIWGKSLRNTMYYSTSVLLLDSEAGNSTSLGGSRWGRSTESCSIWCSYDMKISSISSRTAPTAPTTPPHRQYKTSPAAVLMSPQRPPYSPPGAVLLRLPVIPDTKETSRQRKGPRVILSDKMQDFPVKPEFR